MTGRRGIPLKEVQPGVSTPLRFGDPAEEHWATRRAAGLFDFSFMACFELAGPGGLDCLHALQTRDLHGLWPGAIAYTLLCRDDGTVLDDATVWCQGPGRWWLFTGRRSDRVDVGTAAQRCDAAFTDLSGRLAILAVQGPRSFDVLARGAPRLEPLRYFRFARTALFGLPCRVARIGYSGELGYEVVASAAHAPALWDALVDAGRPLGLRECGFEALDALRVEAGYLLFARELALPLTPFELGLGRFVARHRTDYRGAGALRRLADRVPARKLVGLAAARTRAGDARGEALASAARLPAAHGPVVTSAAFSPVFGQHLALGVVPWDDARAGSVVRLANGAAARVMRLPFYDPPRALPRA